MMLLVQAIVAGIVLLVLKGRLHRELVDAALEKLQASAIPSGADIRVVSAKALDAAAQERVTAMVARKAPQAGIVFDADPSLKGGIMFEYGDNRIDFSVSGRLKTAWM